MNGFTRKKVMSLTLGERLQQIRAERRMSLNEVSRGTRIQSKYLQYLESGEYDKLPAQVYVKGFLRSYATFVGVNECPLIKAYERERGIQNNIRRERDPDCEKEKRKRFSISTFAVTPRVIVFTGITILIMGGFFYLYREVSSFISTPVLLISSPLSDEIIEGNQVYIIGKSEKDGRVFVNEQPVVVNDEGEFKESVGLQEGLNLITIRAINRFDKETVKTLSIHSPTKDDSKPFDTQGGDAQVGMNNDFQPATKIDLEIGAKDNPVWVSIEADGKLVFSGVIQPSSWHKFTAQSEVVVSSGRGNETLVKVNGQNEELLGPEAAAVKDVIFNLDVINNNQVQSDPAVEQ